ncbi:MAG: homoserine dehydrogenase [SAR202 cluster bacterium]|nr:homoserine dehydrogenase [Dehalococcoidia bacterium]MQG14410.1 homoserine dehydrogenase [SAR202 cluster bacterium]MQG32101.1 homoserine dehydrogenase [SAR202 cluster bacterium]MQG40932.1 homoserine dehydrogenase [SAR202 cluster bacterium]
MASSSGMSGEVPDEINVGLMGLGVVGTGVAAYILGKASSLAAATGRNVNLKKVLVRDITRARDIDLPSGLLTTNAEDILADAEIHIVVEVIGGTDPVENHLKQALAAGKHIVTANKEVMAKSGPELLALARKNGANILFEASVGGGIPIVGCLMNELAANDIRSIRSIINGTTNYILTRMANERTSFDQALSEAQGLGYAEADPINDIEGIDAAYKLTILASLAYRQPFQSADVYCEGISRLEPQDFRYAQELGYAIKSLAIANLDDGAVQLRVYPALVPSEHMLAKVDGVYNAVEVDGSLCGQVLFHGMGAGSEPTTSAVVGDLIEVVRKMGSQSRSSGSQEWAGPGNGAALTVRPIGDLQARYYIRLDVADNPGVLAQIAQVLGDGEISIAAVLQRDTDAEAGSAEIVITTHPAKGASMQDALQIMAGLSQVRRVSNVIRIEE